jgi:hypothetical protein
MITGVRKLDNYCTCGKLAVVEVTRTNDELPQNYIQWGTRTVYHCARHIPKDVKRFWNSAYLASGVADSPIVKKETL